MYFIVGLLILGMTGSTPVFAQKYFPKTYILQEMAKRTDLFSNDDVERVRSQEEFRFKHSEGIEFMMRADLPARLLVPFLNYQFPRQEHNSFSADDLGQKQRRVYDRIRDVFDGWHWDLDVSIGPYELHHPGETTTLNFVRTLDRPIEREVLRRMSDRKNRFPTLVDSVEFILALDMIQTKVDRDLALAMIAIEYNDGWGHFKKERMIFELLDALKLPSEMEKKAIIKLAEVAQPWRVNWQMWIVPDGIRFFNEQRDSEPGAAQYIVDFQKTLDRLFERPEVRGWVVSQKEEGVEDEKISNEFRKKYFPWMLPLFWDLDSPYYRYCGLEGFFRALILRKIKSI